MNKRGQFFIIAAIIIILAISGIVTVTTYAIVQPTPKGFFSLSSDLEKEGSKIVDYGIYNEKNLTEILEGFTSEKFGPYFLQRTDNANVIFVYGNKSDLFAVQYKPEITGTVSATVSREIQWQILGTYTDRTEINVQSGDKIVNVTLFDKVYQFELRDNEMFYFLIIKEEEGERYVVSNSDLEGTSTIFTPASLSGIIHWWKFDGNALDSKGTSTGILQESITWTKESNMDVVPENDGWTLNQNGGSSSISNGELTIATSLIGIRYYGIYNIVDFNIGFTFETRMKATVTSDQGIVTVSPWSSPSSGTSYYVYLDFYNDGVGFSNGAKILLDVNNYHTYRVTVKDSTAKLYIDGELKDSVSTISYAGTYNRILFGDINTAPSSTNNFVFDYFKYSNSENAPATYVSGKKSQAVNFDGIDDYVDFGDLSSTEGSAISIAFWAKVSTIQNNLYTGLVGKMNNGVSSSSWGLYMITTGSPNPATDLAGLITNTTGNNNWVSAGAINDDTWHFYVGTWNGNGDGKARIYKDGVLVATSSSFATGNIQNTNHPVQVGRYNSAGRFFKGIIDEVSLYDKALSQDEITQLYNYYT